MWIFSKYGFFSVTQHAKRRDNIQVRARTDQDLIDLKHAFPALDRCPIIETPDADYRWRLIVQRWKWDVVGAALVADIDYGNFKGKMATIPTQREKCAMLHDIWDVHHTYQQRKHRPDPHAGHPELFRPHGDHLFDENTLTGDKPDNQAIDEDDMEAAWSAYEQDLADMEDERRGRAKESDPEPEPEPEPYVEEARKAAVNTRQRDAKRDAKRDAAAKPAKGKPGKLGAIMEIAKAKRGNPRKGKQGGT